LRLLRTGSPRGIVAFMIALVISINDYCRFLKVKRASCFFSFKRRALRLRFREHLADAYLALIRGRDYLSFLTLRKKC